MATHKLKPTNAENLLRSWTSEDDAVLNASAKDERRERRIKTVQKDFKLKLDQKRLYPMEVARGADN